MKSLEQRIAEREKDRERERKDSLQYGNAVKEGGGAKTAAQFDAADYVSGNVESVLAGLEGLSERELVLVAAAEKSGKGRVSVQNAISELNKKRENKASLWSNNVG